MAFEVKLPQLGQTMEEGTFVTCLARVGDQVKKGDVIFEVETDKATLEMESPADGFVKAIVAQIGQTLPVGDVCMILGDKDETVDASAYGQGPSPAAKAAAKSVPQEAAEKPAAAQSPAVSAALPASANVVKLPQLGQTMEEGTIVSCLVKVGAEVKKGDVVFEVETDKATLEMESPAAGFVKAIVAQPGETVPVGGAVLVLGDKELNITDAMIASLKAGGPVAAAAAEAAPSAPAPAAKQAPAAIRKTGRIIASPRAKLAAKNLGVDLGLIAGTGPGGRVTEKDVQAAASAPVAKVVSAGQISLGSLVPLNRLQRITAERMLLSKQTIPCFYLTVRVDMTNLVAHRTKVNETATAKIAYNDFIVRAVAMGLEKFPIMTGQLAGSSIKLADDIGIGLAISVPDGLVAPIVHSANKKTAAQIASDSKALIDRARAEKLTLEDLEGGCITVSNLGAFGIDSFIPIVVPGQCSILGIGQIADTCVPDNGGILIRKIMSMTLSVDHKVANGAYAAQFLDFVKKTLEDPSNFN
jgi:pyruvate dehydrogenase E2 component (dihydrolipoamide acetyltransferase)